MRGFSANLGFLWADLPLPEAVRRAARAGFDAVELHYPYATPMGALTAALREAGLPLVSLNTPIAPGAFGLAAVPGAEERARAGIVAAFDYARAVGAGAVHVMAGAAAGREAEAIFRANLNWAVARADGLTVLIEPLNPGDAPGYFLSDYDVAAALAGDTGAKVMLDCYHAAAMGLDPLEVWDRHGAVIGHIQFADHPGRGAPGSGTVPLERVLRALRAAGYGGYFGAEYRPACVTEDSLGWLGTLLAS